MDLEECKARISSDVKRACNLSNLTPWQRRVKIIIGRIDPVTGICDNTGLISTLEREVNLCSPTERGSTIVYTLDRNVGNGVRGALAWVVVGVVATGGKVTKHPMTIDRYLFKGYSFHHSTLHWDGVFSTWYDYMTKIYPGDQADFENMADTRTLKSWALLLHYNGEHANRVMRAIWNRRSDQHILTELPPLITRIKTSPTDKTLIKLLDEKLTSWEHPALIIHPQSFRYKRAANSVVGKSCRVKILSSEGPDTDQDEMDDELLLHARNEYNSVLQELREQDNVITSSLFDKSLHSSDKLPEYLPKSDDLITQLCDLLGLLIKARTGCRKYHKLMNAVLSRRPESRNQADWVVESSNRVAGYTSSFASAECARRGLVKLLSSYNNSYLTSRSVDMDSLEDITSVTQMMRAISIKRRYNLVDGALYSIPSVLRTQAFGALDFVEFRRHLSVGRQKGTGAYQAWLDILDKLRDSRVEPLVWRNGEMSINENEGVLQEIRCNYGQRVLDLFIVKRKELEIHNPSGLYPVSLLWDGDKELKVSEALTICIKKFNEVCEEIYRYI